MRPFPQPITCLRSDVGEDIGADIPSTESVEVPVRLDGRDLRVMVVVVAISRAFQLFRDNITEEESEDLVLRSVVLVLVEGD